MDLLRCWLELARCLGGGGGDVDEGVDVLMVNGFFAFQVGENSCRTGISMGIEDSFTKLHLSYIQDLRIHIILARHYHTPRRTVLSL